MSTDRDAGRSERTESPIMKKFREFRAAHAGPVECALGSATYCPGRTRRVPPKEHAYEHDGEAARWGDHA